MSGLCGLLLQKADLYEKWELTDTVHLGQLWYRVWATLTQQMGSLLLGPPPKLHLNSVFMSHVPHGSCQP